MRVALVHDWLTGMRGGEKVLESFCRLFPRADLFTLFHEPGSVSDLIENRKITTSFLDRIPGARGGYRYFLPLFPQAIETFDLSEYDLAVSISHAVAKGVRARRHVCYCETPMRYVWDFTGDYFRKGSWKDLALRTQRRRLREWDVESSRRVHQFLANSDHVRQRVQRCYNRDAKVIYPPVDTDFFTPSDHLPSDYYLVVSALEPYKRVDLAVEAFSRMKLPLIVAGRGTQERALRRIAKANVEFLGWRTNEELRDLYRGCRALIFPGLEDFGIVPVEAQACGRPVVAYGQGGALETVKSGVFFPEQTVESLIAALEKVEEGPDLARANALKFSKQRFEEEIRAYFETDPLDPYAP